MSCISFLSPEARAQLIVRQERRSPEQISAEHPSPPVTEGKLRRIRLMAASRDPKIRESAALNRHAPPEVLVALAGDSEIGVRCCVARNDGTSSEVLSVLARDESPGVRGWVAANPSTSRAELELLSQDPNSTVRSVLAWAHPVASPRATFERQVY